MLNQKQYCLYCMAEMKRTSFIYDEYECVNTHCIQALKKFIANIKNEKNIVNVFKGATISTYIEESSKLYEQEHLNAEPHHHEDSLKDPD